MPIAVCHSASHPNLILSVIAGTGASVSLKERQ